VNRPSSRLRLLIALTALVLLGAGAIALASVTVYSNDFSSKHEFGEIERGHGKHCDRNYRAGKEVLRAVVTRSPETCSLMPPVFGDAPQPDHIFQFQGKILTSTPKKYREKAFLLAAVRVGGGGRYELRVFPKTHKFQLSRRPNAAGFPVEGMSADIEGIGKRNKLRIQAIGDQVRALVNGTNVGSVVDPNPGQLEGTKMEMGVGNKRSGHKKTEATFDRVRVEVPNP
jgi:hypothetical protein